MNADLLWRLAADAMLLVHLAFVLFVVLGLAFVLLGAALNWRWIHDPVFRWLHLLAITVVVVQAWLGITCPLTTLENLFRARASQAGYPGDFVAWWVYRILYWRAPPAVFTALYTGFGLLVAASWFWIRPSSGARNRVGGSRTHRTG